jgi:hypothetical protein
MRRLPPRVVTGREAPRPSGSRSRRCRLQPHNILLLLIIISVLIGIALGVGLKFGINKEPTLSPRQVAYLKFPGEIFLRMLKVGKETKKKREGLSFSMRVCFRVALIVAPCDR